VCVVYCLDSQFVSEVSKFVAGSLQAMSAMVLLELPHLNVLTKVDLLTPDSKVHPSPRLYYCGIFASQKPYTNRRRTCGWWPGMTATLCHSAPPHICDYVRAGDLLVGTCHAGHSVSEPSLFIGLSKDSWFLSSSAFS